MLKRTAREKRKRRVQKLQNDWQVNAAQLAAAANKEKVDALVAKELAQTQKRIADQATADAKKKNAQETIEDAKRQNAELQAQLGDIQTKLAAAGSRSRR